MSRLILTDRDREALHRLADEWRSEPASEDRGARTRETLIGLTGGGEHFDQHAAYLLALSLVELLSPAHLPPRAGSIVLRALESLADGEGGGEYVKIVNDLRSLPDAPALPDSPSLSLLPGMGGSGAGGARAGPRPEGADGDASAAWRAPPPEALDPETGEHAIPNLPGVDFEALARRTMQFAGDGARDRAPGADGTTGRAGVRDGTRPIGGTTGDRAQRRTPLAEGTTGDRARNRTPFAENTLGDDARYRAPAAPGLEPVLFVESAGERFALRAGDVAAILGAGAHAGARIDDRPPVFVHHGVSYHFVDPAPALGLGDVHGAGESDRARAIVLLRAGGRRVALLCGGVDEQEELPVHALPPMVPREAFATAAVIAGDGRPILLLDTAALAEYATG